MLKKLFKKTFRQSSLFKYKEKKSLCTDKIVLIKKYSSCIQTFVLSSNYFPFPFFKPRWTAKSKLKRKVHSVNSEHSENSNVIFYLKSGMSASPNVLVWGWLSYGEQIFPVAEKILSAGVDVAGRHRFCQLCQRGKNLLIFCPPFERVFLFTKWCPCEGLLNLISHQFDIFILLALLHFIIWVLSLTVSEWRRSSSADFCAWILVVLCCCGESPALLLSFASFIERTWTASCTIFSCHKCHLSISWVKRSFKKNWVLL